MYSLKAVKTFHGHDGNGWEANLYHDKKKVALVVEDGWGGELQFHWVDNDAPKVECDGIGYQEKPMTFTDTPEEALFRNYCLTLPKWKCIDEMVYTCMDVCLSNMVDKVLTEREVKKLIKKVAYIDGPDIFTLNCKGNLAEHYTPSILSRHPEAVILNTMPLDKAVELYTTLQG